MDVPGADHDHGLELLPHDVRAAAVLGRPRHGRLRPSLAGQGGDGDVLRRPPVRAEHCQRAGPGRRRRCTGTLRLPGKCRADRNGAAGHQAGFRRQLGRGRHPRHLLPALLPAHAWLATEHAGAGKRHRNRHMSKMIRNPILPGFNPDPSIVRVGDDYYIATSTFEWYPGVQIHHSRDLVNWRLIAHPLDRADLLDMRGNPDSGGIWAPCLSYADGLFWLVYTDVKRHEGSFKDMHNYLTTCATIDGRWSDRIYLNSSGFDASLFHDDDGRKWLLNMEWDYRPGRHPFNGILLQEYDPAARRLTGPVRNIFTGTDLQVTEGPHVYRRNGYYYLLTAEGGTGYTHAITMARSRHLEGPYEVDPLKHLLTAKDDPTLPLQRAGHGDWVETQNGEIYIVHLCGRPLSLHT